jgi:hypothetical protein
MCGRGAGSRDTDTAIKEWFGSSKLVDGLGQPMAVYHGGRAGIVEFGANYRETLEWASRTGFRLGAIERQIFENPAFFFTDDDGVAEGYAEQFEPDQSQVYEAYLRIERPLDIRPEVAGLEATIRRLGSLAGHDVSFLRDMELREAGRCVSQVMRRLHHLLKHRTVAMGHDGIIMPDTDVRDRALHTSFVVFDPGQIMLLGNPVHDTSCQATRNGRYAPALRVRAGPGICHHRRKLCQHCRHPKDLPLASGETMLEGANTPPSAP